jgi:hypothetical protein
VLVREERLGALLEAYLFGAWACARVELLCAHALSRTLPRSAQAQTLPRARVSPPSPTHTQRHGQQRGPHLKSSNT